MKNMDIKVLTNETVEEMVESSQENFGPLDDLYDSEAASYIIQDGEVTEYGKEYFARLKKMGLI